MLLQVKGSTWVYLSAEEIGGGGGGGVNYTQKPMEFCRRAYMTAQSSRVLDLSCSTRSTCVHFDPSNLMPHSLCELIIMGSPGKIINIWHNIVAI